MTAGMLIINGRHGADEEARAEVDVLNSRLEKTARLTGKIQACLGRLEATGKSVREVAGPINGETKKLHVLGKNIDAVLAAIERLRQPADSKNEEEHIIQMGPDKAGLANYLASMKRLTKSLNDMVASNIRSTQQTVNDLSQLVRVGNQQLESCFSRLLSGETPRSIEPLHFITKQQPFPTLSQDKIARLGLMNSYVSGVHRQNGGGGGESPIANMYAEIRSKYVAETLFNLAAASINMAKRKNPDKLYRAGTNGIATYAQAMEGLFLAEYENICSIFTREDWGPLFQTVCQPALVELGRTLRELNGHIKAHIKTDCYLAYEIVEIVSALSNKVDSRTGELKDSLAASLKPVRETAKASLPELLDILRRSAAAIPQLPPDGAPVPLVSEAMQRLQTMVAFLRPLSSIMVSLGDGGWKSAARSSSRGGGGGGGAGDAIPSLASFDIGADGQQILAHYCFDTLEALLGALDARAKQPPPLKRPVLAVFLANSISIIERSVRESELGPLLEADLEVRLGPWRKQAMSMYSEVCKDLSVYLFDVIHTNRGQRPTSGQGAVDSASVMKGLSSKDKEAIKAKFTAFNLGFDDMVARHRSYSMERDVRQRFAKDTQTMIEPLYNRFWDRYHEIDKGKGKYVKYDKNSISGVFLSLYRD